MTDEKLPMRRVLDVSGLPTYAFGRRSLMWWGAFGTMLIMTTAFVVAVVTYFYLRGRSDAWPVGGVAPGLLYGTLNTLVLLASAISNEQSKKAAEREDLRGVRIGLVACLAFAVAFLGIRVLEFASLHTTWNESAYGSIVFALMTLQTIHVVTHVVSTMVLTGLMFAGPLPSRRYVDVSESALYGRFVLGAWLLIYAVIYLVPRMGP